MHPKHWLDKKPQTIKDWLGLAFLCLAFFTLAGQAGRLLAALGALAGLAAPFAWAIVLAYVLDTLVRPIHQTVFSWPSGGCAGRPFWLLTCWPGWLCSCWSGWWCRRCCPALRLSSAACRTMSPPCRAACAPCRTATVSTGAAGRRARRLRAVDDRPFGRDHGLGPAAGRHAGQPGRLRGADLCGCGGQHVHAGRQRPPAAPAAHAGAGVSAAPRGRAAAGTVPLCQPDLCGLFLRQDRGLGHHRGCCCARS